MRTVFGLLAWLANVYLIVLIARLVIDWIQVFARSWRPRGVLLVLSETVYSLTDPPLKALRKVIPPLRLGSVAIDLSFIVLMIALSFLVRFLLQLS